MPKSFICENIWVFQLFFILLHHLTIGVVSAPWIAILLVTATSLRSHAGGVPRKWSLPFPFLEKQSIKAYFSKIPSVSGRNVVPLQRGMSDGGHAPAFCTSLTRGCLARIRALRWSGSLREVPSVAPAYHH